MSSGVAAPLPLPEAERACLDRLLDHGEVERALLTCNEALAGRLLRHPALEGKALSVRQFKSRRR